jgi:hypothetical protein
MIRAVVSLLFLALFLVSTSPAAATAPAVTSVGFQCTHDPQYRVWFHSYTQAPAPAAQADATALANRICQQFKGTPINAKVKLSDGSTVSASPTANVPTNLPPTEAVQAAPAK